LGDIRRFNVGMSTNARATARTPAARTPAARTPAARTPRRIRIGVDTGGTFTDVVALDESSGELVTTKTPSTPHDPSEGFMTGIHKVLALMDASGGEVAGVAHGTTVATNHLLEGKVERLGFVTNAGYEFLLEIARQSVPDGYGNSYFWVKPPRIVPADLVRTVGGRLDVTGAELHPFDRDGAVRVARWFRHHGITTIGVCFLHAYANPAHEHAMREVLAAEHPDAVVSISSDVLREYREYERSMTTLVDAAVKPRVAHYVASIASRLNELHPPSDARRIPFTIMKSNGGVLSADEIVHQPITTVLSGPAAGALGAALLAGNAGFDKVLTLDGGGTSTDVSLVLGGRPTITTEGSIGAYPSRIPMIDIVTVGAGGGSIAWISPEGTLKVGPRSAGADPGPLCYRKGGTEPTITDAHLVLGRIPPHLLGGEIPLDADAAREGIAALAGKLGLSVEDCARGILEISAWNQANALRQVSVKRGLDVREFVMATFGGSGSLLACRLVDILGLAGVVVPPDPGNVSAFGLLTVDVRTDHVQTAVQAHDRLDLARVSAVYAELEARAAQALDAEGFPAADHQLLRTADLRYAGQAFEVRVDVPAGPVDDAFAAAVVGAFHAGHEELYGYSFAGRVDQRVEWVNLRVTGVGPITRPQLHELPDGDGDPASRALTGTRRVVFDEADEVRDDTPVYWRPSLQPGDELVGPAIIEEFGSTVPVHPGFTARVDRYRNLVLTRVVPGTPAAAASGLAQGVPDTGLPYQGRPAPTEFGGVDPVLVEIVEGTLASVEKEVETAIGRTSRSPMIRDAHDFRAGIHDLRLRKLTGRSYSALVHPVARDFPPETMHPGDVFFHNDVYESEGGIGHLPDLCITVPVFHDDGSLRPDGTPRGPQVVAFVQAFGHHDDIGGACPGSMPSGATSVFEEGLMVPPIKLWDAGVPNQAALRIMTRNSRMPDSLAADLDAECSACLMGALRLAELFDRYGRTTVEACFQAILDKTTQTYRREILSKIPDGTYVWEDYAEHDGVDEPRLHTQRITLTKTSGRTAPDEGPELVIDFTGTAPQAKGPINHCGDYADGNFLIKWLAPILRNLADTPERMAELDVNEGVVPLIELRFPPKGTLLTPVFPAPTNARTFVILRLLGVLAGVLAKAVDGRMPADQETIRYTGVHGYDAEGRHYLMREVLGGGSGGRWYADGEDTIHVVPDSRNIPTEFSESRFPMLIERLGLAVDSGGAGRHRGGLGYEKHLRMLRDASFMSIADRSILSCWGVKGGKAGRPFQVTIDPGGPDEREVEALTDAEPVRAGEVIRIRTTGGGGWGDPLDRPYDEVRRDLLWGKVSVAGAQDDYGVVVTFDDGGTPVVDVPASDALRDRLRAERPDGEPFFDRGPGYPRLAAGATASPYDYL
jgi:N-methylhydantoinase A/oxoprolinase/acetone carboxylase beta subunit/N-methylhydantoinase B/oxoprolinase/acetone carboxylase alpha subunit